MRDEYRRIEIAALTADQEFQYRASGWHVDDLIPSLRREGQLFPILVRPAGEKFQVISGFRRVGALRKLGEPWVQARILYGVSDEEARRMALAENLERHSLTPWDQIATAARFRAQGIKNAEIAEYFRVKPRTIQRYLKVANAPDDFRRALERNEISGQQAYEAIQHGVPLSELLGHGRSVRYLRGLSRKRAVREHIKIQHRRGGEIIINIRYDPGKVDLSQLLSEVKERLMER